MVNSPMTMAKVRKAPERTATSTFGRITRAMMVIQPAPRRLRGLGQGGDVDGAQAGVDGAVHVGEREHGVAGEEQEVGAGGGAGERQDRGGVVEADVAEDDDDGRDDQRQEGDELDERPPAGELQPDPVGGRHDDEDADEDGEERHHRGVGEGGLEARVGEHHAVGVEGCRRRGACGGRTRACRSAARRSRSCRWRRRSRPRCGSWRRHREVQACCGKARDVASAWTRDATGVPWPKAGGSAVAAHFTHRSARGRIQM